MGNFRSGQVVPYSLQQHRHVRMRSRGGALYALHKSNCSKYYPCIEILDWKSMMSLISRVEVTKQQYKYHGVPKCVKRPQYSTYLTDSSAAAINAYFLFFLCKRNRLFVSIDDLTRRRNRKIKISAAGWAQF